MNLKNIDKATFVQVFGEEGLELIEGYDCDLWVVNNEGAASFGVGNGFAACAIPFIYAGEEKVTNIIIINVERTVENIPFPRNMFQHTIQKVMRGQLVHERTHIKQMMDGRLINTAEGTIWEGVKQETISGSADANYFSSPWEQEAYIAQYMYEEDLGFEEAQAFVLNRMAELKAA